MSAEDRQALNAMDVRAGIPAFVKHDDLCRDLADFLGDAGRLVFRGVGVGSRWLQGGRVPVPDVMTMRHSYTRSDVTVYEVKAHRGDFLADVGEAKFRRYIPFCDRLYFATERGLLQKSQVPAEAGLIVRNQEKRTWAVVKASPRHAADLDRLEWQSLLFARAEQEREGRRLRRPGIEEENLELRDRARRIGVQLARLNARDGRRDDADQIVAAFREAFGDDAMERAGAWGIGRAPGASGGR